MTANKSEEVFVAIRDPIEIRRDILECSKEVIDSLKKFQNLERLKAEKFKEINSLRAIIRDISRKISKLKSAMPKTKIRLETSKAKEEKKTEQEEQQEEKEEKPVEVKKKPATEIDKLEFELSEIESKLNELSGN